jgi:hypothetical protein
MRRKASSVITNPEAFEQVWIDNCVGNAGLVFETDKNKSFRRAGTLTANDVAGDLNRRTMSRLNRSIARQMFGNFSRKSFMGCGPVVRFMVS